jgi:predicted metalloprotease with PDZ domain
VIHLHLDLREPSSHLVGVRIVHQPRTTRLRFSLPAWTPGSYLIRDYVRFLEGLEVHQGGRPLQARRTGVASWEVPLAGLDPITIHYRVMATELTVRTCHLCDEHGFLALAAVALALEGERWSEHRLHLELPADWCGFVPLPQSGDGAWISTSFDQLVDTPVEAGPHRAHGFTVAGVPHRWVTWGRSLDGRDPLEADPGWLEAVEQVCLACCRALGTPQPPCGPEGYLFILHLGEAGYGGLEHDHSCVLQYGRRRLASPEGRRKLLQLVAHEYLHQWNVRRLRAAELTPYRYDQPVVVPTLWFAEGVTSYLDLLLPHAAGLTSEADLLEDLGADLSRYLLTPGRQVQSLSLSSEEAWVKLYKPHPDAPDSQISYYLKGAVLALVLDLWLRRRGASLLVVLRTLWQRFGVCGRGYCERDLVEAFAGPAPDLAELLPAWLQGCEDPPMEGVLADVGLCLQAEPGSRQWLGWQLEGGPAADLVVRRVWRGGPAQRAGLMVGDEVLAIDGQRLRSSEQLDGFVAADLPLRSHRLLCCRDGLLQERTVVPQPPLPRAWRLQVDPAAAPEAAARRRAWLRLEAAG